MNKGTHFIGQPVYGQLIDLLDRQKILSISREKGGERYVKHFDAWQHLVVMLYAVIRRFDSLREITDPMFTEARKLSHPGIGLMPRRSTLSDANARRPESIFEAICRDLYATYRHGLSSDSRKRQNPKWLERLRIIDSTTIGLFSSLLFRESDGIPRVGRRKAECLVYEVESDTMLMTPDGRMEYRIRHVAFTRKVKGGDDIVHHARIITYVDMKKTGTRPIRLLTNDMDMDAEDIVAIYRKRWEIELLFKQLKQNFPLRYFYGESANAIKMQVCVTLMANLPLMVIRKRVKRT